MPSFDSFKSTEEPEEPEIESSRPHHNPETEATADILEPGEATPRPLLFKRWMNSFRAKKASPSNQPQKVVEGWFEGSQEEWESTKSFLQSSPPSEHRWRFSGHSSNLESIKTSAFSIGSQSIIRSRHTTRSANQSLKSDLRDSTDSSRPAQTNFVDSEAQGRAMKRRQVLRELIATESEYIFGLKALTDVLYLFSTRPGVYYNLQSIRQAHEGFLSSLQKLSPMSTISESDFKKLSVPIERSGPASRSSSLRAFRTSSIKSRRFRAMVFYRLKILTAEADEALEVALELQKLSMSFKNYEEYCHNYQLLAEDVDVLRRSIPNWSIFNQGIEALSKSIVSLDSRSWRENKALSLNDLLIKPIQRLCKYPLLLQELSKCTQVQDDPSSHNVIKQVLETVRDVVCQINDAPANPVSKTYIQRTHLLQAMIKLPGRSVVHDIYEQLGPLCLCGVLHLTYQQSGHITGNYMVCTLFRNHFLISSPDYESRKLQAVVCLYICDLKIDALRNGRGLSCHGCLYSWKLSFHFEEDEFELVLSASSAHEEKKWKTEFLRSTATSSDIPKPVQLELRGYAFLSLDLTPLGSLVNSDVQLPRRPSIHSTAIPRPDFNVQPIVIKKTHCPYQRNLACENADGEIERPKTLSSPALVLTSRRQDRIRLERFISPIYSRESLRYPGICLTKNDILFGPGSLMRRLSLRPVLHRRASSSTLPGTKSQIEDSNESKRPNVKVGDHHSEQRQESSEVSFDIKREISFSPPKLPSNPLRRSKTLRVGFKSKSSSELSHAQQGYKGEHHHENPTVKVGFRTVFNSMSLKRPKRNRPSSLGGER